MSTFIIGDIAAQYDAVLELIAQAPRDSKIVLAGDIIDRGEKSRELVEYCMAHPEIIVVRGNHEDMMLDFFDCTEEKLRRMYRGHFWRWNGGEETLVSYGVPRGIFQDHDSIQLQQVARKKVPAEHLEWMRKLPLFYQEPGLLVTHAPIAATLDDWTKALVDDGDYEYGRYVTWCRRRPCQRPFFQVFGHNSHWGLSYFMTVDGEVCYIEGEPDAKTLGDMWAICLDDSRQRKLTGLVWPEKRIIQVPF